MPSENVTATESSPWLDQFSIFLTSRSDRVYNNGRQQIEVTVLIIPADGQTVTEEQYKSLGLAYLNASGEWLALPGVVDSLGWRYQSERDNRYDYYPSGFDMAVPVELPYEASSGRLKRFYVHCSAAPGDALTLRGTIDQAPGVRVRTDESLEHKLLAEPSPRYSFPEDYHWQKRMRVGDRLFNPGWYRLDRFVFEYALRPKHVDFSHAGFASSAAAGHNLIRWGDGQPNQHMATVVSVAFPQSAAIAYDPVIEPGTELAERLVKHVLTPNDNQIVVVAQGVRSDSRAGGNVPQGQPLEIDAYDRYGAVHRLAIDFESAEERVNLQIKHRLPAEISNITFFKVAGRGSKNDNDRCLFYGNRLQQTYIKVMLKAEDSEGRSVPIPREVLDTMMLVDYYTAEPLLFHFAYSQSRTAFDMHFEFYPHQPTPSDTLPEEPGASVVTFYIRANVYSSRRSRVAAILIIGGKVYDTRDASLPAGEGVTSGGRSNNSATLDVMSQDYRYADQDFVLKRYDEYRDIAEGVRDLDLYDLRLNPSTGHRLAFWGGPNTSVGWDYAGGNITNWIYIGGANHSVIAHKDGISQAMVFSGFQLGFGRIKVYKKWIEGETNEDVYFYLEAYDEWGYPANPRMRTAGDMNVLQLAPSATWKFGMIQTV
ncbi:hypothetical protein [Pseudomonas soli]|uniref:hypothetical protein n=1 Tax=Pseudomonas soli TaxID=1306993 RepID=UPI003816BF1F